MDVTFTWRGDFTNAAVNTLHAEAFGTEVFSDDEWDWQRLVTGGGLRVASRRLHHGPGPVLPLRVRVRAGAAGVLRL